MEIKTTREIINDELGVILNSVDYDVNNSLFEINKNKKWVSVESLIELRKSTNHIYTLKMLDELLESEQELKDEE
jgi:hypothetical protein